MELTGMQYLLMAQVAFVKEPHETMDPDQRRAALDDACEVSRAIEIIENGSNHSFSIYSDKETKDVLEEQAELSKRCAEW
jgi:hypothetical protein